MIWEPLRYRIVNERLAVAAAPVASEGGVQLNG
jgi:hypothetical protein